MDSKLNIYLLSSFLIILVVISYFDHSSWKLLDGINPVLLTEQDSVPTAAESKEEKEQPIQTQNFELEEKLVDKEEVDGYVVETYREYEIYKDQKGNIKKVIPTSNYNYLRYKKDE
ncbi:hypothetical protein ACFOU2_20295 [Bacillus songklensis]|uniref:Uncharacterized protein n=1 Tax=Bacillus songklensis TaxID=1069116 RepID=A0ABV8B726_9BACI